MIILSFLSFREKLIEEEINKFKKNTVNFNHHRVLDAKLIIEDMVKDLKNMGEIIGEYENINDPMIKDILNYTTKISYLDIVGVINEEGLGFNNLGKIYNLSDREYFKRSQDGKLGVSKVFTSTLLKNEKAQIISYPFYNNKKEFKGMVYGIFYFKTLEKVARVILENNSKNKTYLLDLNGNYINKIENQEDNFTFWKHLKNMKLDNNQINRIKKDFNNNTAGEYQYDNNGITYYGHYIPLENFDGYFLNESGDESVALYIKQINTIVLREELITGFCFTLMLLTVYTYFKRRNEEIKEANKKADENLELIYKAAEHSMKTVFTYNQQTKDLTMKTSVLKGSIADKLSKNGIIKSVPESIIEANVISKESIEEFKKLFKSILLSKESFADIKISYDNKEEWCKILLYNTYDKNNLIINTIGIVENITEQKLKEKEDKKKLEVYEKLIKNSLIYAKVDLDSDNLFELNGNSISISFSHFLENNVLPRIKEEHLGFILEKFSLINLNKIFENNKDSIEIEFILEHNSIYKWVSCIIYKISKNDSNKILFVINDIDNKKIRELELKKQAEIDGLTKLYNITTMRKKIEFYLNNKDFFNHKNIFILLDLDNYKKINDNFGHLYGDEVLKEVSFILKEKFRSTDLVGRLGGDEFIIFLTNVLKYEEIIKLLEILRKSIEKTYEKNGVKVKISCSIGIAISPDDGITFEELYRKADKALYNVKKHGKNSFIRYKNEN